MWKRILLVIVISCLSEFVSGCSEYSDFSSTAVQQLSAVEQSEEQNMKHEILVVSESSGNSIICSNDRGETYLIEKSSMDDRTFEAGQRIGISYTQKELNSDGIYVISAVKITRQGAVSVVQNIM